MSDTSRSHHAPVPIRSRIAPSEAPPPPEAIVQELRASLRATDVYVRLLIDRIELACTTDRLRLDGVPADALAQMTAAADTFQSGARRTLCHIDPGLVETADAVADLMREAAHSDRRRS